MESWLSFPDDPLWVTLGGHRFPVSFVLDSLTPFLTPHRSKLFQDRVNRRTWHIVPVLENLYDLGNLSACLRSADAIGLQSVMVLSYSNRFKEANRVSRGADKWLFIDRFTQVDDCIKLLRKKQYKIVATAFTSDAISVHDWDWNQKTAIVFGNEHQGVSSQILEMCDAKLVFPMNGFVQSLNISIAFALICYLGYHYASQTKAPEEFFLIDAEKLFVMAHWAYRSLESADQILQSKWKQNVPAKTEMN